MSGRVPGPLPGHEADGRGIEPLRGANPITVFETDKHASLATIQKLGGRTPPSLTASLSAMIQSDPSLGSTHAACPW